MNITYKYAAAAWILMTVLLISCNAQADLATDDTEHAVMQQGMPIVSEPIALTFFTGKSPSNGDPFEDILVWKKYAKLTNMNIQFELVPFDVLTEKRALSLEGDNLPDGFYSARLTPEELAAYGKRGVLIPLDDLIDAYAPNFKALLEKYPMLRKGLVMPDGHIYSFPSFYDPDFLSMQIGTPLWVNKQWLDELGMAEPRTTAQFRSYLLAVKGADLNGNGKQDEIPYSGVGIGTLINQLKGAWGLGNRGLGHKFVDVDPLTQQLRFTKALPGYKEMLQYIHGIKKDGLLDKEIFSIKENALNAKGNEGLLGAMIVPNPAAVMRRDEYIGLGALQGPYGDHLYTQMKVPLVHQGAFAVTSANRYPEATVRWMDYFFGEEGASLFFMGEEGVTYAKDEKGQPQFLPFITDNPDGLTMDQALMPYVTWLGGSYPGFVRQSYFKGSESMKGSLMAAEKARPDAVKEVWGKFSFTKDEELFMLTVGADLEAYISDMELKFINGSVTFAEWDSYLSTLDTMGVREYMQMYEQAYERYVHD
ncbi:extracellular solute-binding protein [Paenibacillus sp. 2TAB23]|uniref:extracellular solute-binding protein n=1 Tax=Paenibacillus sp. 2TAB23 TaxID=3233004 RepID=UPI003F9AE49C